MASKSATTTSDVLLSFLKLPPETVVLCASYAPIGDQATHALAIDNARRLIHNSRDPSSPFQPLLAHVDVQQHDSRLAVFAIASKPAHSPHAHALRSLALHNLVAVDTSSFDFHMLYSNRRNDSHSPTTAFVTPGLHRLYLMFLAALRDRILADICDTYSDRIRASCVRLRDGFLLIHRPLDSEWAFGWDDPQSRLAHCRLHLHWMDASTIVLRPIFTTVPYARLSAKRAIAGTPIALLPYDVPAYFIAPYTGSTAALSQQFRDSLVGLGVGPSWERRGYILCWIPVHASQNEDKAVLAVWPTALAVACTDRPHAKRLPTVPDHFAIPSWQTHDKQPRTARARAVIPVVTKHSSDVPSVAVNVAGFVDAMAREREREREKAKEERYRRLNVSVPQSGVVGGPRSTLSGSAGGFAQSMSASDHFPSPGLPLSQFTSPPNDVPAMPPPPVWGAPQPDVPIAAPASSFPSVDDFYSALGATDDMASFGLLTEDDFSFFDQPAVPVPPAEPPPDHSANLLDDAAAQADIIMSIDDFTQQLESHDGMGMPLYGTGWTPEYAPDPPRTAQFTDMLTGVLPSPAKTPWTPAPEPATPSLVFAHDPATVVVDPFDQIPFAVAHSAADAKYTAGKFSATLSVPLSPAPSPPTRDLRERYRTLTNPSVGVVQRLRMAKRKSIDQGRRASPSPWERSEAEWIVNPPSPDGLPSPPSSDADSSDEEPKDDLFGDDYEDEELAADATQARAPTPVPDAVLIGPALLHAAFAHRALLPLGVPLPPPGSSAPTPAGAQPISVPTPVSPAAAGAGATPFERARSLEPVATAFAREVVENATWAAAWQMLAEKKEKEREVWQEEIGQSVALFGALPYLAVGSSGWSVTQLAPPEIVLEKGGILVPVAPTALRFWEKMGFGPRAGAKHVSAFVLYEDGSAVAASVAPWLESVSKAFASRGLGTHVAGKAGGYELSVPLKWELFRKTLAHLVTAMAASPSTTASSHYVVFYIAIPQSMMTLSSLFLRNILGVAAQHMKLPNGAVLDPDRMLIHLLPEAAILDSSLFPVTSVVGSVYDRLPRIVERHAARPFFKRGLAWRSAFDAASFTLARRPGQTKVNLQWDWPIRHLDVVEKNTFLHVAYRISQCRNWVFFAATDERGESHSLMTWAYSPDTTLLELVQDVWKRAMDLAGRASVSWRLVIAKSGSMGREEYEAWVSHFDNKVKASKEQDTPDTQAPDVQITLVGVHRAAPFTLLPLSLATDDSIVPAQDERPSASSYMTDVSWRGYMLDPPATQPLSDIVETTPAAAGEWSLRDGASVTAASDDGVVPAATVTLLRSSAALKKPAMSHVHLFHLSHSTGRPLAPDVVPAEHLRDIVRNYGELSVLGHVRSYGASSGPPVLPLHLAAVEHMDRTFAAADMVLEVSGNVVDRDV
ncbi:hypothetical protein EXIGLDRAFT_724415 [Exidia glandulosa HHB12029]|uniref:Mediator of RNA polymerase II transcription subunit 13 n=1 Tax=Exidia glandulosa HHB12029 TaxID=1314781 RepID=A0A165EFU5_EXIGL|nr:hypothetical protein EXIGLDRAFT_724415 [Exidia glandulosa HHB12029]